MSLVQERSTTGSGTSIQLAFLSNNQQGNLLVACIGNGDDGDVLTNVTDTQGNTWQQAGFVVQGEVHVAIWYAENCKAGANTVTANFTASEFASNLAIAEESLMEKSAAFDVSNTGTAFDLTVTTASITTTVPQTVWYAVVCSTGSPAETFTPDADFTERWDLAGNRPFQVQRREVNSILTDTATWTKTGTNANLAAVVAAFKLESGTTLKLRLDEPMIGSMSF